MSTPRAVLSVDFESLAHTPAYRGARGTVPNPEDVGPGTTERLLATLDRHDADATAFVVSETADRHPDRLRGLADAGHEIASHTHSHPFLSECTPAERREELARSRSVLSAVTGAAVTGFRAPSFDVTGDQFQVLAETGYEYDSSVVPCRSIPGWYGGEWSVRRPTPAAAISDGGPPDLLEVPVAVMPGLGLPLTGTWMRLFGVRYVLLGMRLLAREGIAPVLYVHPWEFVSLPSVEGLPKRLYIRTGAWMWRALERILSAPFEFVTARSVVGAGERS